jgi:hypothetical protein
VFTTEVARSIAIAYPADLGFARDVMVAQGPVESNTLWGVNGTVPQLSAWRAGSEVVVYFPSESRRNADELDESLVGAGCVATDTITMSRFSGTRYQC